MTDTGQNHGDPSQADAEREAEILFQQWKVEDVNAKEKFESVNTIGEKRYLHSAVAFINEDGSIDTIRLQAHLGGDEAQARASLIEKGVLRRTSSGDWIPPAILTLVKAENEQVKRSEIAIRAQPVMPPSILKGLNETLERQRRLRIENDETVRIQTADKLAKKVSPIRVVIGLCITIILLLVIYFCPAFFGNDVPKYWEGAFAAQNFGGFVAGLGVAGYLWLFVTFAKR